MIPRGENILAFECFETKLGKNYFVEDLKSDRQIEMLFDLTQILCAAITDIGWQHLFVEIGIKRVYQIDKKSGWFDTDIEKEWIESIYYWSLIGGYNPLNGELGKWDDKSNMFTSESSKSKIDWNYIHSLKLEL